MSGTIELATDRKSLLIRFPYREDLVDEVRMIPGRRWDRGSKTWRAPVDQIELVVEIFMRHGFAMAPEVTSLLAGVDTLPPDETPDTPRQDEQAMSISALNKKVGDALRIAFPTPVWIVGEILDLDKSKGKKHLFFRLVEKLEGHAKPAATVDVALFENTLKRLEPKLDKSEELTLRDGIQIRVLVKVEVYAPSGRYQVIVEDIDPDFTLGQLALSREKILANLRKLGLHERNAGLPLPVPPLRIAVLTSTESDGWNDFRRHIEASGIGFELTCFPIKVQGSELKPTMMLGLQWFAERSDDFDVMCVLRGGGSRSDLAWFDDEDIATSIAHHPLKVICGIGHQRDQTVLDAITHSEKTPTAAAAFLVDQVEETIAVLEDRSRQLIDLVKMQLRDGAAFLVKHGESLRRIAQNRIAREQEVLVAARHRLILETRRRIERGNEKSIARIDRLHNATVRRIEHATVQLARRGDKHRLLDPRHVLQRGYALVRDDAGHFIKSVTQVSKDMMLNVALRDGKLHTRVESIEETKP